MTDRMPLLTVPALIVIGLLVHQAGRICEFGISEIQRNYAPVFAIALPRRVTAACQAITLPVALIVVVTGPRPLGLLLGTVIVLAWVATIQRRLANHVWLGTLALIGLVCAPTALAPVIARDLLAGLYLSAALFKVNWDYLTGKNSPGRVITEHYATRLGLPVVRPFLPWVPVSVIACEFAVGVLLLLPGAAKWGLFLAIFMHWAFGITGNFPFSIIALVLWVTAFSLNAGAVVLPATTNPAWLAVPVSLVLAVAFRWKTGKLRSARFVGNEVLQSAVFGFLVAVAISHLSFAPVWQVKYAAVVHFGAGILFVLNIALVMLGVKLEFSFAMFSGLRPFGRSWLQRCAHRGWPRYYSLTLPDKIPEPLIKTIGPEFLYKATRADNVVYESIAYNLENAAKGWRTTFSPCAVVNNRQTGNMERCETETAGFRPRRMPLLFPAVIPRELSKLYLG